MTALLLALALSQAQPDVTRSEIVAAMGTPYDVYAAPVPFSPGSTVLVYLTRARSIWWASERQGEEPWLVSVLIGPDGKLEAVRSQRIQPENAPVLDHTEAVRRIPRARRT